MHKRELSVFVFVGLILFFSQSSTAQYLNLGDRVGEELDRRERDYFALFPTIVNFESARFTRDLAGQIIVEISPAGDGNTPRQYLITAEKFEATLKYIELYDTESGLSPELMMALGGVAAKEPRESRIKLRTGETLRAKLFCADSAGIGILQNAERYDPERAESLRMLAPNELWAVSTGRNNILRCALAGLVLSGIGAYVLDATGETQREWGVPESITIIPLGLVVGAGIGLILSNKQKVRVRGDQTRYLQSLPQLQSMAARKAFPPELRHSLPLYNPK